MVSRRHRELPGRGAYLPLAICILAFLIVSCAEERVCSVVPEPKEPDPVRVTPNDLVDLIEHVYQTKDAATYGELLADQYQFCPIEEGWDIPEHPHACVDRAADLAGTERMFADPNVQIITFDFAQRVMPWYECMTQTGAPALCGVFKMDIRLRVGTEGALGLNYVTWSALKKAFSEGGTPLDPGEYWVNRAMFDVKVIPDPEHPSLWVILRIAEFASE